MIYYEQLSNGDIGRYTNSARLAQQYGWTGQTDTEPIRYKNKLYLQNDLEAIKESDTTIENHETVSETTLAVMEAIAAQEERIAELEVLKQQLQKGV